MKLMDEFSIGTNKKLNHIWKSVSSIILKKKKENELDVERERVMTNRTAIDNIMDKKNKLNSATEV